MVKVDISDNMGLAEKYGIQYLPTLVLFTNGEVVATQVGLVPPDKLQKMINSAI